MKIWDLVVDTFMFIDWLQQDISCCFVAWQRWLYPAPRDATDPQYKYNNNTTQIPCKYNKIHDKHVNKQKLDHDSWRRRLFAGFGIRSFGELRSWHKYENEFNIDQNI